ncbi:hypothetical protein TanjilG_31518 [Lupinus angustifolius]|uniref:Uncharacterized protein n=1 Tax=Lupinus angustifolius TaxID=3871 RepID=A0A4P1RUC7_LUPAN|nr:hypothetical protein TanjilG_31518 [Lupinus angustifolius]
MFNSVIMQIKKVTCTILFAAASVNAAVAHEGNHHESPIPTPGPNNGASALGSFIGAFLLSFIAYYVQS